MSVRTSIAALSILGCLSAVSTPAEVRGPDALEPPSSGGVELIDRALARLAGHKRVLMVGAHPDDEDNRLLALLGRQLGAEAAYLSLSRGEGGQNLIGSELGVALGLLRTGELEAARALEGGRQFFTRAFDFGYTRSLDETLAQWPESMLLEDAVRIVRRFKPQVIVSIFPGDGRGRHGQHQAAGIIAHRLFEIAGDPSVFPNLAADEGLEPWQPQALYRAPWWTEDGETIELPLDDIDPWRGRSIHQLAAESRGMHRSQDMGRQQELGPQSASVEWVGGARGEIGGLFGGIDTSLAAIAALLPEGELRDELSERLTALQTSAEAVRGWLTPAQLRALSPSLAGLVVEAKAALDLAAAAAGPASAQVRELLAEKLDWAEWALVASADVIVDAAIEQQGVATGTTVSGEVLVWNAGPQHVELHAIELVARDGWRLIESDSLHHGHLHDGVTEWAFTVGAPESSWTLPYFLRRPTRGAVYDWSAAEPWQRGLSGFEPPLVARLSMTIDDAPVVVEREVVFRAVDQALGEVRQPLRALPPAELSVEPGLILWPIGERRTATVRLHVRSHLATSLEGVVRCGRAGSWRVEPFPVTIAGSGERTYEAALVPPVRLRGGRFGLPCELELAAGGRVRQSVPLIDYDHIRPVPFPSPARLGISALDLELPTIERLAWVRGASDPLPELLAEIGLPVEVIDGREVGRTELGRYDAIVVGSRAFEVDPHLGPANERLLDYARGGGTVLVLYQQYDFVNGGYAPYPFEIARPHDRITDERSPVRLLAPEHPVFNSPNRLAESDWAGWVTERGLYLADSWDPAFTPLIALEDPGQPEQSGALLIADVGEGRWLYSGLSFFRQLPAGVPGAYRLLVNLLALAQ